MIYSAKPWSSNSLFSPKKSITSTRWLGLLIVGLFYLEVAHRPLQRNVKSVRGNGTEKSSKTDVNGSVPVQAVQGFPTPRAIQPRIDPRYPEKFLVAVRDFLNLEYSALQEGKSFRITGVEDRGLIEVSLSNPFGHREVLVDGAALKSIRRIMNMIKAIPKPQQVQTTLAVYGEVTEGTDKEIWALGIRRAKSLLERLRKEPDNGLENGLDTSGLSMTIKGAGDPVSLETDDASLGLNRRWVISIYFGKFGSPVEAKP